MLAVFAVVLRRLFRETKLSKLLNLLSLSWLLLWSQPYMANILLYPLEHTKDNNVTNIQHLESADYIVVLACFYNTEGQIPEISRWSHCSLERLVQASILHKTTNAPILLTGGRFLKDDRVYYSDRAKAFLVSLGVSSDNIQVRNVGTNTHEEISAIKDILNGKNIVLVTTATHLKRVSIELEGISVNTSYVPVDYYSSGELTPYLSLPSLSALQATQHAFYEYLAQVKQKYEIF